MADEPEEPFFLRKIHAGLRVKGEPLAEAEVSFLQLPLEAVRSHGLKPREAKKLIARCVTALSNAYLQDMSRLPDAFNSWREYNVRSFKGTSIMLDCLVQEWYITRGYKLERRIRGIQPLYTWYSLAASRLWDEWLAIGRKPKVD